MNRRQLNKLLANPLIDCFWPGTTCHVWRYLACLGPTTQLPQPSAKLTDDGGVTLVWESRHREFRVWIRGDELRLGAYIPPDRDDAPPAGIVPGDVVGNGRKLIRWVREGASVV